MKSLKLNNLSVERLDIALAETLNISRSAAQKQIKAGLVLVNKKVASPHLGIEPETIIELLPNPAKQSLKKNQKVSLDIIFEDSDVIVINKPAGILVHQAPGNTSPTLVDALIKHAPEIKKVGSDKLRAGIVHRLDKDASGVIIAAKTKSAFEHLKKQFSERLAKKIYTVLVLGKMKDESGTINFPIARSSNKARMAARPVSQVGKEAITHYQVKKRFTNSTLLQVHIETGRTHQIRAHFFALGFPVAGDKLYKRSDIKDIKNLDRLFLHATELTVSLPNNNPATFSSPLPKELTDTLASLKIIK